MSPRPARKHARTKSTSGLSRSKVRRLEEPKPKPTRAEGTAEARALARWKRPVKRLWKSLDAEPRHFANELIRLAFGPESLPGIPAWAQAAARRFVGISLEQLEEVRSRVAAQGPAEAQRALSDEMERTPDMWGMITGLSLRVVSDLERDLTDPEARKALAQTVEAQRRLNELDARKAAAKGVGVEAEYLKNYGLGLATDAEAELKAADGYRDLCGIVVWKWREIAELKSRAAFRDFLLTMLPRNRVGSDKRLEHFCRLIGLSFRPPGRPKGSQNKEH